MRGGKALLGGKGSGDRKEAHMRKRLALSLMVAAATLGALGGGVAVAVTRAAEPQTHAAAAQFTTGTPSVADHHECQGVDGMYDNFH